ncbi:MAG: PiT family inorganic phosphate transporter [Halobacteriales archaeon]|jgi:PiT family inorganic phosphate transporter
MAQLGLSTTIIFWDNVARRRSPLARTGPAVLDPGLFKKTSVIAVGVALELLLLVGIGVAVFVGFNIGGSSTGVAFGPAVGSGVASKLGAAILMSAFALLGGWTVGRNVIQTMGGDIVPSTQFTLAASVAVLFFVGLALLVSNLFGVPASTSMTAVGAIAGLGVASGRINWDVMGEIVSWWLVAPILAFWVCAVVGRYLYPYLAVRFAIERSEGSMFALHRDAPIPYPTLAPGTGFAEFFGSALVVAIGCYMAFSAGASNVANAVAPLVGSGELTPDVGVLIAGGAIGLGAFTIARRTLDTVGNDLTDLPLLAALIVETVSASIITFLSSIGIPASLAVSATMCIVGLGWGRATRTTSISQAAQAAVTGEGPPADAGSDEATGVSMQALAVDEQEGEVAPIGEEEPAELTASDLFDPGTTGRVVMLWILTPSISAAASFALFSVFPLYG